MWVIFHEHQRMSPYDKGKVCQTQLFVSLTDLTLIICYIHNGDASTQDNVSIYSVINTTTPAGTPIESSTTEFDFPRRCKSWRICIRFSLPTDITQRWRRTTIQQHKPEHKARFSLILVIDAQKNKGPFISEAAR